VLERIHLLYFLTFGTQSLWHRTKRRNVTPDRYQNMKNIPLPAVKQQVQPGNDNFNLFCLFQTMIGVETENPEGPLNKPVSGFFYKSV